ncbi:MAG: hypothetical protein KME29_31390 [Calothrix sp. FI2-JRJ7]|nr:hypothetical protein [Calothrix sp. FI2-JRJ7]
MNQNILTLAANPKTTSHLGYLVASEQKTGLSTVTRILQKYLGAERWLFS